MCSCVTYQFALFYSACMLVYGAGPFLVTVEFTSLPDGSVCIHFTGTVYMEIHRTVWFEV